jgi:hypothetical protein
MVYNLPHYRKYWKTVISTSGNWKTKRPVVEKTILFQTVIDTSKLHMDHLLETGYAAAIDDIISGQWGHIMPWISYPPFRSQWKRCLTSKRFNIRKNCQLTIIWNRSRWIDWWRHFRSITPPSGHFHVKYRKIRNIEISTPNSLLIGIGGLWIDRWHHFRTTTPLADVHAKIQKKLEIVRFRRPIPY